MQVVNRKGEREDVRFDAILDKLRRLAEGLDPNWIDPANLTKLTIEGLYDGVTTRELDQLAAETAASLVSQHPDYSKLAARICVDDLHVRRRTFTDVITDFENTSTLNQRNMLLLSQRKSMTSLWRTRSTEQSHRLHP